MLPLREVPVRPPRVLKRKAAINFARAMVSRYGLASELLRLTRTISNAPFASQSCRMMPHAQRRIFDAADLQSLQAKRASSRQRGPDPLSVASEVVVATVVPTVKS